MLTTPVGYRFVNIIGLSNINKLNVQRLQLKQVFEDS